MRILGICGTAKNTGKTTTLGTVVGLFRAKGVGVFLTSIGYDGEDLDTTTGLPKPKVVVEEGDMVATALPLVESSSARFGNLGLTGVYSALGPVVTAVATSPGRVVIAGPVSTKDVKAVFEAGPPDRPVLLDGAFSRLAPMSLADDIIIATGAARSPDPSVILEEIAALDTLFGLPVLPGPAKIIIAGGLYAEEQVEAAKALVREGRSSSAAHSPLHIDGMVSPQALEEFMEGSEPQSVVFRNPIHLLVPGDADLWPAAIDRGRSQGWQFAVKEKPRLLGFTLNPFRPEYDEIRRTWVARYVDAGAYLGEVRRRGCARCTDVVHEGPGTIEAWLKEAGFFDKGP